jgi:hypothetical protein
MLPRKTPIFPFAPNIKNEPTKTTSEVDYGKYCNNYTVMFITPSGRKLGHKIILQLDEVITKM